ncbi:chemotaxis protein CheD [Limnochorda pilosa]|uniref:Probable chemoreceptor glutamine deamidase CheD n=1 Tax=Limnochorda pilosa TaxID=1555112 RepID=A0A0K2SFX9_LIMPI|nr:chemotaxis protein CheD [Limnochorda pilosa]BAS25942.1 chemotaxis protein CheD [Limnochorda pilosa]
MRPLDVREAVPTPQDGAGPRTVGLGELVAASAPTRLVTYGLGSCVGLCLYDPFGKVGGLAHVFLPWGDRDREGQPALYANLAVERLVAAVAALGGDLRRLEAKMAGGARLFAHSDTLNVGERNVEAVRTELRRLDLRLVGEDVGGTRGRSLLFDLADGRTRVTSGGRDVRWI